MLSIESFVSYSVDSLTGKKRICFLRGYVVSAGLAGVYSTSTLYLSVRLNTETEKVPTARIYRFILSSHLFRSRKKAEKEILFYADIASI